MVAAALDRARRRAAGGRRRADARRRCQVPRTSARSVHTWSATGSGGARGQVIFAGGQEAAVVDQPRLLEVVRTDDVVSLRPVLQAVIPGDSPRLSPSRSTDGGTNPRFGPVFEQPAPGAIRRRRWGRARRSATAPRWQPHSPRRSRLVRSRCHRIEAAPVRRRRQGARAPPERPPRPIDAVVVGPPGQ